MNLPPPNSSPPGWYPDPHQANQQRWWDGSNWTQHVAGTPEDPLAGERGSTATTVGRKPVKDLKLRALITVGLLVVTGGMAYPIFTVVIGVIPGVNIGVAYVVGIFLTIASYWYAVGAAMSFRKKPVSSHAQVSLNPLATGNGLSTYPPVFPRYLKITTMLLPVAAIVAMYAIFAAAAASTVGVIVLLGSFLFGLCWFVMVIWFLVERTTAGTKSPRHISGPGSSARTDSKLGPLRYVAPILLCLMGAPIFIALFGAAGVFVVIAVSVVFVKLYGKFFSRYEARRRK